MRIRRLRLANFRTYGAAGLELPDGLCGIVGPNGSGKTTLFEAIGYALYGELRTNVALVRSSFAPDGEACEVEIEFEIAGMNYRLLRKLSGKALVAKAELYKGRAASPIAASSRGVSEQVRRLLNMDRTTFFASVFARQKQVDALTEIPPGQRQAAFRRMLNVDVIDRVLEAVRAGARDRERDANTLEGQLKPEAELVALRDELGAKLEELAKTVASVAGKIDQAAKALEERKEAAKALEEQERRHSEFTKGIELASQALARIEKHRRDTENELAEAVNAATKLKELQPELQRLRMSKKEYDRLDPKREPFARATDLDGEIEHLRGEVAGLKNASAPLEEKRAEFVKLRAELREAVQAQRNTHGTATRLATELSGLEGEARELEGKRRDAKSIGAAGTCPTCHRKMGGSFDEVLAHFDEEIKTAREKIAAANEAEKKARDAASKAEKAYGVLDEKLEALRARGEDLAKKRAAAEREDRRLHEREEERRQMGRIDFDPKQHAELKRGVGRLGTIEKGAAALAQKASKIGDLRTRCAELATDTDEQEAARERARKGLKKLGFDPNALVAARRGAEAAHKAVEKLRDEAAELKAREAGARADFKACEKEIAEQASLRAKIAEAQKACRELAELAEVVKQFQIYLTDRIRPALAQRAARLLARATEGRYDRLELDDEYNVRLYDGAAAFDLSRYSGGETDLVNLCLRIAIAQVVAERGGGRLQCVVFDEVFGSQDATRRDLILRALGELKEEFLQLFVITHDETVRDRLPNVIEVRLRSEGVSEARLAGG